MDKSTSKSLCSLISRLVRLSHHYNTFYSLRRTDDTTVQLDASRLKKLANLGTIQVKVHRVVILDTHPMEESTMLSSGIDKISEKALKGRAISHTLRYV